MYNILDYLEKSATSYPDKIAISDEFGSCTYHDLKEKSQRVGSVIAKMMSPRTPVAVLMEKSISALYGFLGTVYAGGYYSLLNPELPIVRLRQLQSVLDAPIVVTDPVHLPLAEQLFPPASILVIDTLTTAPVDCETLEVVRRQMIDITPLYITFTSGSTGVPKGVVVTHRSVIDFIDCFTEIFGITHQDIIGNQAPFDFDVSVKDIYATIKTGARMVIIPRRCFSHPKELMDTLCDNRITTVIWAVSALCLISTTHGLDYRIPTTINKVLFSGEVMPMKLLRPWMTHLPKAVFVNLYGPTEATCNCTYHILKPDDDYNEGIPIGRPFPNEDVFLLDEADHIVVAPGSVGEICIRGTALALGYHQSPRQTVTVFTPNPLNTHYLDIIYRTGDLARYDTKGDLYFCGRQDLQIKYMGHRIELEEIEGAISKISGIERCCCVFDTYKQRLYAFYVGAIDKGTLYHQLKTTLPAYMIPGALRPMEALPVTKTGKIDRNGLKGSISHE